MRSHLKTSILSACLTVLFLLGFPCESHSAGEDSAQFLKLGAGARAAGMGNAFSSIADDVSAVYWNPAVLSQITSPQFSFMQNSYLVDSQYQFFGGAIPFGESALGFSLYRLDHGSLEGYTNSNVRNGSFDADSLAGGLTLSMALNPNLRFGVTGKFLKETIENESASGFAGDLGLLLTKGNYNFGLSAQHLGPKMKFVEEEFSLPQTMRLGASGRFFKRRLLIGLDVSKASDNDPTLHGGFEFGPSNLILLRAGYQVTPGNNIDVDGVTGVTGGIGIKLGVVTLDYAITPFGDFDTTHQFSLLIRLKQS